MKPLQISLVFAVLAAPCLADIQDPLMHDQNAIRKLSRGLSNITFGISELPVTVGVVNDRHGNSAAFSYGIVSGVARTIARLGAGMYDVITFPVPSYRGSYSSILPSVTPWVQNGFEEFPPELGFETRFGYVRNNAGYSRLP